MDLRYDFPNESNSVILSILTLQFIPIEYRQEILTKCYDSLNKGGVFILVEKILGGDSLLNNLLIKLYYEIKGTNGYSEEQINAKRKALEGVLVPVTADWNRQLLVSAGFSSIEMFWRNLNFAGWVGLKN
jgi:tRNA (cmo5U34)-methyltransferase